MKIILSPDTLLRQKCEPVSPEELPRIAQLAKKMAKAMYQHEGCGLAAPQIGVSKQVIVLDTNVPKEGEERTHDPLVIINPCNIKLGDETELDEEGCLSIPGITVSIRRSTSIELEAMDLEGNTIVISAEGFDARALQHELDHLEGTTMFERIDVVARSAKLKEYELARAAGVKPGDTSVEQRGQGA
ncbi:MAG: peptide deformylase [Coriobacteriia bacterium]|nr:peptide deformylase [Coriobacteriia bacterium]